LFSFLVPASSYALAPVDQVCSTGVAGSNLYSFIGSNHQAYQAFVPTKNTLDAVAVRVKSEIGASSTIKMEIIDFLTPPYPTLASMTKTIGNTEEWVTFDFPDVSMPRSGYVVLLKNVNQNEHAIWRQNHGNCDPVGYSGDGETADMSRDFGYAVYAYDSGGNGSNPGSNQPPSNGNPPSGSSPGGNPPSSGPSSPIGTTPGSGQPPAQITSKSIAPPTNLTAGDRGLDYGGAIDLEWKASQTSDIDGYKLFRRAEGDNEYVEIIKLPKTFTKFTDPWAIKDKTYYYTLRAFKGSDESVDSNVAFAASKDDLSGVIKDIQDDFKKNNKGGILGEAGLFLVIPIVIILLIIGLFILGLWVLLHKKKAPPTQPKAIKVNKEMKK